MGTRAALMPPMPHVIDVLAHTWRGWAFLGLACVGGLSIAGSFAFVTYVVVQALDWSDEDDRHLERPVRNDIIVLPFVPSSRGPYAFRSELRHEAPVRPFHKRESVQ